MEPEGMNVVRTWRGDDVEPRGAAGGQFAKGGGRVPGGRGVTALDAIKVSAMTKGNGNDYKESNARLLNVTGNRIFPPESDVSSAKIAVSLSGAPSRAVDATEAIQTALRHVGGYHHVKATSDSPNKRPRD